jgi:epithelial splicing regulatory protein 1/2
MHLDSVVKMKSLPFDANQSDIIMFFEAYRLKPNGVQLVVRSDNKPTGEVRSRVQQQTQALNHHA